MKKGTVKFFNHTKGFGFIIEDDTKEEHFVHVTGLVDKINEGDLVEFELTDGRKGLTAINVKMA
ncbi:cold shock domain-containing protein [Bacteroidia bacterium]|jgi:CspA family cold shock protein|nr:cold shock domain-containing protein [Bacteroidia bacterium]